MNLSDVYHILEDFNSAVRSWRGILDSINDAVQDYNAAIADPTVEDPAAYLREWLPQYWQAVRAINIHQSEGVEQLPSNSEYDVGIFLVGFRSLPIVLSIAEIQPRQEIYFIHSNDTRRECNKITSRFEEMLEDPPPPFNPLIDRPDAASLIARVQSADRREIAEPSDPVSTFQEIKNIIDSVGNNARIALDLTGGKKTMIGGGFTAGSIYSVAPKCDMFYVDSLVYNQDLGAPKPGTEFLSQLDNPYNVYNVQSVGQAKELFNRHNYEAAAELWGGVCEKLKRPIDITHVHASYAKRYKLENELKTVEKNRDMATCYRFWNALDYGKAQEHKSSWAYNNWHQQGELDVLNILYEVAGRRMLFDLENKARVIHYAIDRYQNGIRAQTSDKLDDAMVRFTQVIEMLCIYKICQIASTSNLIEKATRSPLHETWCAEHRWRISSLINFLFGRASDYDSNYRISDCSKLLQEVDYVPASHIIELIEHRNNFIHFTRRATRDHTVRNANQLKELAKLFLEKISQAYCCEEGLSFNDLLKLHEFRQL